MFSSFVVKGDKSFKLIRLGSGAQSKKREIKPSELVVLASSPNIDTIEFGWAAATTFNLN